MKYRQRIRIGLVAALLATSCTTRRFATIEQDGGSYTLLLVESATNPFQTTRVDNTWRIFKGAYDPSTNTLRLEETVTTVVED